MRTIVFPIPAQRESEFFAEPVVLKENKLFPIPNYGSAMSPFFTTLSLWAGALLLVSLLSALFMLMVCTLVSVFGNIGKAMAIVLLVLQLAGAGGTFPVQVTPPFFQAIHPFLPFTYATGLMREATGGIVGKLVRADLLRLSAYAAASLVVGLSLKRIINRASAAMVARARESRLIH